MSEAIITVEGLGKRYRLGARNSGERYTALRDVLANSVTAPFRRMLNGGRSEVADSSLSSSRSQLQAPSSSEEFWALRDINFEVKQGEVLGIIGRNGAGKSTLLKILSRITEPTKGRVRIKGRVASLLEVGTGFHPELTGRENIFLNGAILGMTRAEIKRRFEEIVAFAEIEKFLDTPVKRYSSGMYVRLAFAVAAHLDPEILVIDEVLAVGDAEFQKKCLGKMEDVSRGGRTVLFVSHNMSSVQALCGTILCLDAGQVVGIGDVDSQVKSYLEGIHRGRDDRTVQSILLGNSLKMRRLNFSPNPVSSGCAVTLRIELASMNSLRLHDLALLIYSTYGSRVAVIDLRGQGIANLESTSNPFVVEGEISSIPLVEGDYRIGLYFRTDNEAGDSLDLYTLTVAARQSRNSQVPYQASYRGTVDLDFLVRSNDWNQS